MKRILLSAALATASLPALGQGMEPGEWEFTSTMTSPMLPQPQTSVMKHCVSPEDARDPTRFTARDQTADCTVSPGQKGAQSYSWSVACPRQGMSGTGTSRWAAGTVETELNVTVEQQGQKMQMRTLMKGRRLGPCR